MGRSDVLMDGSKSFRSFVNYEEGRKESTQTTSKNVVGELQLIPGEIISSECTDVFFYRQFDDRLFGRIHCTNFRISFAPSFPVDDVLPRRFKLIDERFDVPLCSISHIYYALFQQHDTGEGIAEKRKFKQLKEPLSSSQIVSFIKLYIKDFRVLTVDLTRSQNGANLANHILHFSRPSAVEHLPQMGCAGSEKKLYMNEAEHWQSELERCGQLERGKWRVCNTLRDRLFIDSYPRNVVIPFDLVKHEMDHMIPNWRHGRFPIWTWAHANGASLLRSSMHEQNTVAQQLDHKYCAYVGRSHPMGDPPHRIILPPEIGPDRIAKAYEKLRTICSIDSLRQWNYLEKDWLERQANTGWLQLVGECLARTSEVVEWMLDRGRSVILYEEDGRDSSAVIASLVQVCCDRDARQTGGLDSLIAKEWSALGHPFGERQLNATRDDRPAAPAFLLFLDCLAQLVRLYPTQFNYSSHLLMALWDVSLTGMVPSFACSTVSEQIALNRIGRAFPMERHYTAEYTRMFSNVNNDAAQLLQRIRAGCVVLADVLRPPTQLCDVRLWEECYLRWIPLAATVNGGVVVAEERVDGLMERIAHRAGEVWSRQYVGRRGLTSSQYPYSPADPVHRCARSKTAGASGDKDDTVSLSNLSISSVKARSHHDLASSLHVRPSMKEPRRSLGDRMAMLVTGSPRQSRKGRGGDAMHIGSPVVVVGPAPLATDRPAVDHSDEIVPSRQAPPRPGPPPIAPKPSLRSRPQLDPRNIIP